MTKEREEYLTRRVRYSGLFINYVPDEIKNMVLGLIKKEREEYLIRMVKDCWSSLGGISEEVQTDAMMWKDIDAFKLIKDKKKTYDRCFKGFRHSEFLPDGMRKLVNVDAVL